MKKVENHRATNLQVLVAATMLGGCVGLGSGGAVHERRLTAAEAEARFEPSQTLIGPVAAHEAELRERGIFTDAFTIVDASGGRSIFPMPERTREFANRDELRAFVERELGVDPEYEGEGWRGSYAMINSAYWTDPQTRVRYRVVDPMLAFLGGTDGRVMVGGHEDCIDADRVCSRRLASYLVPEGDFTAVTSGTATGMGGIVATYTSFFNKVPGFWARHGSNARINYSALPETLLRADGRIQTFAGEFWAMPRMQVANNANSNNYSVETAVWAAGPFGAPEFWADAVCGCGSVFDPWMSRSFATGNGPQNGNICLASGENACFVPEP